MAITTNIMGNEHAYQFIIGNTKVPLFYMPFENPNVMDITNKKEFQRTQTIGGQVFEHWGSQPRTMNITMRIRKNSYAGNLIGVYDGKRYDLEDPMICTELELLQMIYNLDRRKLRWTIKDGITGALSKNKDASTPASSSVLNIATGSVGNMITSGANINNASFTFSRASDIVSGTAATTKDNTSWLNRLSDTIIIFKAEIYSGFFTDFKVTEDGSFPFVNNVSFNFLVTHTLRDSLYESVANTPVGRTIIAVAGAATAVTAMGYAVDSVTAGTQSLIDGFL